ncbi:hypothetical protein ASPZODRAFT_154411 [Penicilliopsis zonata CBS 506.65]|uniref:Major facilitator superfamily (MFS) profile domain-containing protein n=1 Tax=Penicilliopsis zonata CBS 506.65 TaxID=1073090 RepID=A0A1L9S8N2_9EURO|nr:hypothetical protein ASPZODRAFT_154411 [Penicilliopsis zonata CBS 506.65]OJJ43515.1 hypothetical protein ASPZODRAFT_154411 [Penicilliopsis zonata CBS 506.65]
MAVTLDELPAGYYRSKNFIGSTAAVCLMAISLYLGYVLPVNSLTAIDEDLGPDPNYTMVSTVFTLISGVALLLVGRLGDIFGRRYFLIAGQVCGLIGSIVCATAKNVPTVIGGSVLCGLAAAVQLTFTFVLAELVPNKTRPAVNAGIFVTTLPFAGFGALIAEELIANTARSWRWSYYLNIITCSLSTILLACFYFPPGWDQKHRGESRWVGIKKLDYVGFTLYAAGVVLILLGLSWGGTTYTWDSAHVVAVLVIGFVSLLAFALYETFVSIEQPILPLSLLRNPGYTACVCSALVGNMVYFSMSILWPTAVAALFTTNAIHAGWLAVSTGLGVLIGEVAGGLLMKPIGHSKYQLIAVTTGVTVFNGALAALNEDRLVLGIAFTALGGFFVGYLEILTIIMCPLYCAPEDIGLASGFLGSAKQIAGTIATAIFVAILDNRLESYAVINDTAYSDSFRTVFLSSIAFGGCAIIAAIFSISVDDKLDGTVAAKLGGEGSVDLVSDEEKAAELEKGSDIEKANDADSSN